MQLELPRGKGGDMTNGERDGIREVMRGHVAGPSDLEGLTEEVGDE